MIITGSLDDLFSYNGEFALLKSDEFANEKNNSDGYNSSIVI